MASPFPVEIKYQKKEKLLKICFDDQTECMLSAEFLRVYSPSAEVQGHHPSEAILQVGKESVSIDAIEPIGNYAVKLIFDDGHDSGLYTWKYLRKLGCDRDELWQGYLDQLKASGYTRSLTKN